jgi:Zn-dependent protease with chaperone function
MLVLVGLLALVYAVGIGICYKLDLPHNLFLPVAGTFSILMVFLQYLLGPVVLDYVLSVRWSSPQELGMDFAQWEQRTCKTFKISEPRLGIIEDQMPNAFTYGHGRWNGRVIISRGLIDILTPEELKAVYAHELGHIKNGDFVMMTVVQALVMVLYIFARSARYSNNKNLLPVMAMSYAAYWLSYYVSLLFSRIREYLADYSSAQIIGNPNTLCRALIKISYGLAQTGAKPPVLKPQPQRGPTPYHNPAPSTPFAVPSLYADPHAPVYTSYGQPLINQSPSYVNQDMDKAAMIAASFNKSVDPKVAEKQQKNAKPRFSLWAHLGSRTQPLCGPPLLGTHRTGAAYPTTLPKSQDGKSTIHGLESRRCSRPIPSRLSGSRHSKRLTDCLGRRMSSISAKFSLPSITVF